MTHHAKSFGICCVPCFRDYSFLKRGASCGVATGVECHSGVLGRKGGAAACSHPFDAFFGSGALEGNPALPGVSDPFLFFAQAIPWRV